MRKLTYRPLPSQRRFHKLKSRFKGFSGPVGSGKSRALCFEAIKLCHVNAGRTGLIGAPTYAMLRDATLEAFLELCQELGFAYTFNKSTMTLEMTESRSRVLFRSLEEYERLRGPNLAWFGVDEMTYTAEEAWVRLEARLRDPRAEQLCGFGVWTPKGFEWVYRRFRGSPVKGYALVEAGPFENSYLLRKTPDYYERLKASYDARFYDQEVLGKYLNLVSGRVYGAFDREKNLADLPLEPEEAILWGWDFNIHPMSSVICQRRGDHLFVVDEIVIRTSSTPEVCTEFLSRYGEHRGGVRVYGDSSGLSRHTVTGSSDYDMIRRFLREHPELGGQVVVRRSNPAVRDRINAVNGLLCSANGERRLSIDRRCKELIQDLEQVVYKVDTNQIDKESNPARTHVSDALGYVVWQEFGLRGPIGEQGRRLMWT